MQISQTSIKDKISVSQNYVKNLTPTVVPGNSTYLGITKHGLKTCVVRDSQIKRIRK